MIFAPLDPCLELIFNLLNRRFEVAGIHPKRRRPGTITQVGYDKKSMSTMVRSN